MCETNCPLVAGCTSGQVADLRAWATDGLVRLWERGEVGFDFLIETQRRLGVA